MSVSSVSIEVEKRSEIKPYQTMRGHTSEVRGVAHLHDGRHIITCSKDASLRLWDRESGTQIGSNWKDDGDEEPVHTIALSPDGKTVASGSDDGMVKLWDIEMRKITAKWSGHTDAVWSVRWSADGMRVASGSLDGTVRVWEMESGETVLGPIKTGNQWVYAVAYSPDSSNIASGGDKAIEIWDTTTGERLSWNKILKCIAWHGPRIKRSLSLGFNLARSGYSTLRHGSKLLFWRVTHPTSLVFRCCRMIASLQLHQVMKQRVCGISTRTSQSVHLYSIKSG